MARSLTDRAVVVSAAHGRIDPELLFGRKAMTEHIGHLSFEDLRDHDGHREEREHGG